MTRWKVLTAVVAVAVALGVILTLVLTPPGSRAPRRHQRHEPSPSSTSTTTTIAPSTTSTAAPTTTTPPGGPPVPVAVPVVVCPTTFGAGTPPPASLPASRTLAVPGDLAGEVALYSDDHGLMMLLGPAGWQCQAMYGADGSGRVVVYPTGASAPSGQAYARSDAQAVIGSETSACFSCTFGQACPLFPAAASVYDQSGINPAGCWTRPAAETVVPLSVGVVSFRDPPGVVGDGIPSGGPYAANGVMTFYPGPSPGTASPDGSWLDTCTLPAAQTALCTAALNQFVSDYGSE